MKNTYFRLFLWIIAFQLISGSTGLLTASQFKSWYTTLPKSPLTPPGYVFGIVWPILYVMIASAGWVIWERGLTACKSPFIIQAIFNFSWTPLFFYFHLPSIGLFIIACILISTLYLIVKALKHLDVIALLTPYFLWSCFAFYLNGYIVFAT